MSRAFMSSPARPRPTTEAGPVGSPDLELDAVPADQPAAARAIVLRLLTGAAKSRAQLEEALQRRGIREDVVVSVLDRFTDVGLVDDVAFAEAWVRSRGGSRGQRALRHELRAKGVAEDLIEAALADFDSEAEESSARDLATSRARSLRGLPAETQTRRLTGLLQRRGYSGAVAYAVAREVAAGNSVVTGNEVVADDEPITPGGWG